MSEFLSCFRGPVWGCFTWSAVRQVAGVGKPRPYPGLGAVRQVAGVGKPRPYPGLGAVRQVRAWASLAPTRGWGR